MCIECCGIDLAMSVVVKIEHEITISENHSLGTIKRLQLFIHTVVIHVHITQKGLVTDRIGSAVSSRDFSWDQAWAPGAIIMSAYSQHYYITTPSIETGLQKCIVRYR